MPRDFGKTPTNVVEVDFKARAAAPSSPSVLEIDGDDANHKKWSLFLEWISLGTVTVLFDARHEKAKVPAEFASRGDLRLNFSHDFMVPDFNSNHSGVWATLSFDSGEFFCMVPWHAVYGMQSAKAAQGAVWFESFPEDLDQVAVLGFSEEMCETIGVPVDQENERDNVVALDFPPRNDVP